MIKKPLVYRVKPRKNHFHYEDMTFGYVFNDNGEEAFDFTKKGRNAELEGAECGEEGLLITADTYTALIDNTDEVINSDIGSIVMYIRSLAAFDDSLSHVLFGYTVDASDDFVLLKHSSNVILLLLNDGSYHYCAYTESDFPNWQTGFMLRVSWDRNNAIFDSVNLALSVDGELKTPASTVAATSWNEYTVPSSLGILNNAYNGLTPFNGWCNYCYGYSNVISIEKDKSIFKYAFSMFDRSRRVTIFKVVVNVAVSIGALPELSASLTGVIPNLGVVTGTLPEVTGSNTLQMDSMAVANGILPEVISSNTVEVNLSCENNGILPEVVSSNIAESSFSCIVSGTLPEVISTNTIEVRLFGEANGILPEVESSVIANVRLFGVSTGSLPLLEASNIVGITLSGEVVSALPELESSNTLIATVAEVLGIVSGTLPEVTGSNIAELPFHANVNGILPELSASLTGWLEGFVIIGYATKSDYNRSVLDLVYPQLFFPIMHITRQGILKGTIKFQQDIVESINSITNEVYEVEPYGNYWKRKLVNLQTENIFSVTSAIYSGRQFLEWRFNSAYLSGRDYYGLFITVNKGDDAGIGQAYIEIIVRISNRII